MSGPPALAAAPGRARVTVARQEYANTAPSMAHTVDLDFGHMCLEECQRELPEWEPYVRGILNKNSLAYSSLLTHYLSGLNRFMGFQVRNFLRGTNMTRYQLGWNPRCGTENIVFLGQDFGSPDLRFISDVFFRFTFMNDEIDLGQIKSNLGLDPEGYMHSAYPPYKEDQDGIIMANSAWEVSRDTRTGLIELGIQNIDAAITVINTLKVYKYLFDLLIGDQVAYKYTIGYGVRPEVQSIEFINYDLEYEAGLYRDPAELRELVRLVEDQSRVVNEDAGATCGSGLYINFYNYLWDMEETARRTSSLYQ